MGYAAPLKVEGQPRENLPYGLFSVLTLRESNDAHWSNGIEWEAMTCDPASGIDNPDCETEIEKVFADWGLTGEATSFTVYGSFKCGAPGGRNFEDAKASAIAHLLAREQNQAESYLWERLAAQATDIHPSGALDPLSALAALEKWLGFTYGSLGVINADRGAVTLVSDAVRASGSRLLTQVGTPVIAGGGYPGTSPAGADPAAGETWVFASPALFGYRGQVFDSSARAGDLLDRTNNDLYAIAERQYVIGFDPCGVAAVRMSTGEAVDGGSP